MELIKCQNKKLKRSWVLALSKGGLTVPSLDWMNKCSIIEQEFDNFYFSPGQSCLLDRSLRISKNVRVLKGFYTALSNKYPDILNQPLKAFLRTRLFIRIKIINQKLTKERTVKSNRGS